MHILRNLAQLLSLVAATDDCGGGYVGGGYLEFIVGQGSLTEWKPIINPNPSSLPPYVLRSEDNHKILNLEKINT